MKISRIIWKLIHVPLEIRKLNFKQVCPDNFGGTHKRATNVKKSNLLVKHRRHFVLWKSNYGMNKVWIWRVLLNVEMFGRKCLLYRKLNTRFNLFTHRKQHINYIWTKYTKKFNLYIFSIFGKLTWNPKCFHVMGRIRRVSGDTQYAYP